MYCRVAGDDYRLRWDDDGLIANFERLRMLVGAFHDGDRVIEAQRFVLCVGKVIDL
jgi:hypothetical protein